MFTSSSTSSTQSSSADTGLLKNSSTSGSRIAELEAAVGSRASGAFSGGVKATSVFKWVQSMECLTTISNGVGPNSARDCYGGEGLQQEPDSAEQ